MDKDMDISNVRRSERLAQKSQEKNRPGGTSDKGQIFDEITHISKSSSSRSAKSGNTIRSTASSRRRVLEARAAREKAELEMKKIEQEKIFEERKQEAKKAMIEARLDEELAHLEEEEEVLSQSSTQSRVQQWVKNSMNENVDQLVEVNEEIEHTEVNQHSPQNNDITDLTRAITSALKMSSNSGEKLLGRLSARDLPTFSGDPLDWLRFKNAFDTTTRVGQYSDAENVARLQKCLHGEAWESVAARLITATSADEVMKTLEMRFGRPDLILHKLIGEMKKIPKLTGTRSELVVLATKVSNCVAAIEATKHLGHLHSNDLISEIMNKLTEPLIYRWLDYSAEKDRYQPRLRVLAEYLMQEAQRICKAGALELPQRTMKPVVPFIPKRPVFTMTENEDRSDSSLQIKETSINTVSEARDKKYTQKSCYYCAKTDHSIDKCPTFRNEEVNKRWEWVCQKRLCFKCLSSKHRRDRCKPTRRCPTCKGGHHFLLHRDDWPESQNEKKIQTSEVTANVWATKNKQVFLKVLPIVVEGPTGSVNTYALLDEGSTVTLVDRKIAEEVGAQGSEAELHLQGAVGDGSKWNSKIVSLTLRSPEGDYRLDRVRTVDSLSLPTQTIDESDLARFQHLKKIPIQTFKGQPTLLIGQDYWHLIVSRKIQEGRKNEPVASLTRLGWVLHGFVSNFTNNYPEFTLHVREDVELHELVKSFFSFDNMGIKYEDCKRQSAEERRAVNILETKTKRIGDRWETGLLWRADDIHLPNNRSSAEHRLRIIEKLMDSDPADYSKQVSNMLEKNYAEEVVGALTGKRIWFLPHFGVRNPNKPGKLRLVFDAKAETKGVSLNTELLSGPDLLNSLIGVLLRFRERAVAVTADIREMFLQVKILDEDQKAQLFLWRGSDRENSPRIYKMTSMIFGATSSPCTANFILRHNAEEYASTHPRAVMAIKRRHYVDDYLDSVDSEEEMKQLVTEVIKIHEAGGFNICGWASNKPSVLPQQPDTGTVTLLQSTQPMETVERTLGLNWNPATDRLGFDLSLKKVKRDVAEGLRRPTKREMLKVIMSVFDPLGMLSPFLIRGKIMLQDIWRSGTQWDEKICEKAAQIWFRWLQDMKKCQKFSIPRFYGFKNMSCFQLHVFVDASEQAYAAVAYLRHHNKVAFVAAKSRVAPLKPSTIPRLELQAALMGARLGAAIQKEHDVKIEKRFFWTDSRTVWWWINNNPRQNKPFVSNRLSEIDELTRTEEWRWLPGNMNVADEATRADSNIDLAHSRWVVGPEFLRLSENNWPSMKPQPDNEEEPRQEMILTIVEQPEKIIDDSRFSNWRCLARSLARAILFTEKCRRISKQLTPQHVKRAEILILQRVQSESFPDDIASIKNGQNLKPTSKLRHVNPEFDETDLLRVRSRLEAGRDLPLELKRPIILDGRHRIARLIVEEKHKDLGHHNTETLVNEIRQKFYIFRLRVLVKNIIANCVTCRARRARCEQPMMAGLPPARLQHHCRPFTYCGVDFFGPMLVTIGRRHEKRWGMIFTCFNTRAVHIELAASLSTDSTIMAIRRMAARRGYPKQIYSDNGTNFRGADKELQRSVKEILDDKRLTDQATLFGIEWRFNAPEAPHMGGVWERLIRSIKTALFSTLNSRAPKEEILTTLLAEAENIVNSRPLTHVSLDPNEEEALTPNHFLCGASNPLPRTGEFSDQDLHLRKQWRIAQRLTDHFWSRWMREYLPSLQTRTRWTSDNGRKVCIDDLVLIADCNAPRNVWPRGKIVAVKHGRDGRVRIVDVATQGGILRRPVSKIVVLLGAEEYTSQPAATTEASDETRRRM